VDGETFDFVRKIGIMVIESATVRSINLRDENCVEIWHGVSKVMHSGHHVSVNVTHLPSKSAVVLWLGMFSFEDIQVLECLSRVLRMLGRNRAAFVAQRPEHDVNSV